MIDRRARTGLVLGAGLAFLVIGIAWTVLSSQAADRSYEPLVAAPAFSGRARPEVLIDEAHYNVHTAGGSYAPFAQLLRRDGYWVRRIGVPHSAQALRSATNARRVLVIANPLGWRGALQAAFGRGRLERLVRLRPDGIPRDERVAIDGWVRGGGSLLLVADHAPAGEAARTLAAVFGVEMTNWWAEDSEHHDTTTGNPGFVVFSRDNGLLGSHPIIAGRHEGEAVVRVMTFTGQALRPPPGAASLLTLSASARQYPFRHSREHEGRSAAGLAQAVALEHGAGRVVVLGEAAMITAQTAQLPDGTTLRFGMSRSDTDNRQFALNVMHWLTQDSGVRSQ
jgi:hypothetical protein